MLIEGVFEELKKKRFLVKENKVLHFTLRLSHAG